MSNGDALERETEESAARQDGQVARNEGEHKAAPVARSMAPVYWFGYGISVFIALAVGLVLGAHLGQQSEVPLPPIAAIEPGLPGGAALPASDSQGSIRLSELEQQLSESERHRVRIAGAIAAENQAIATLIRGARMGHISLSQLQEGIQLRTLRIGEFASASPGDPLPEPNVHDPITNLVTFGENFLRER